MEDNTAHFPGIVPFLDLEEYHMKMVCETNEQNQDDTNLLQSNGSFYEGNPEAMMACLDGMHEES